MEVRTEIFLKINAQDKILGILALKLIFWVDGPNKANKLSFRLAMGILYTICHFENNDQRLSN